METLAYPDVPSGMIGVHSPKGNPATLSYREDTSDLSTIGSTWRLWGNLEDEYGLAALPLLTGTAIDIGAHIGTVALALLADHPDLRVIAVEPLSENCDVIRASAEYNGWSDRLTVIHGGIAAGREVAVAYDFEGDANLVNHRYIGGMTLGTEAPHRTETVQAVRLTQLVGKLATVAFLKVDCEGCEWDLLSDPAIAKVERIAGEGHPSNWLERVHGYLDATHEVTVIDDRGGPGTFRAVLR